jgi:hypothetical protein
MEDSLLESSGPLQTHTRKEDISDLSNTKNDTVGKENFQNLAEK